MKSLQQLLKNEDKRRQPQPLFSKLREMKMNRVDQVEKIHGIPMVESDESDQDEQFHEKCNQLRQIRQKLEKFKNEKAQQVVIRHLKTKQAIEYIVNELKDSFQYQALRLIDPNIPKDEQKIGKIKQCGSTMPSSQERKDIQTPGFDLLQTKSKPCELTIDLRQFTLGQKNQSNCDKKSGGKDYSQVSQFQINSREPSSRRIKDKIMNSNKNGSK